MRAGDRSLSHPRSCSEDVFEVGPNIYSLCCGECLCRSFATASRRFSLKFNYHDGEAARDCLIGSGDHPDIDGVPDDRVRQWVDGRPRCDSGTESPHGYLLICMVCEVNGPAFNDTFDTPGPVIQGFIVACFDREST